MIIPGYGEGKEDQEENESFIPFSRKIFRQFKSQAARKTRKTFPVSVLCCFFWLTALGEEKTRLGLLEILELVIVLINCDGDFIDCAGSQRRTSYLPSVRVQIEMNWKQRARRKGKVLRDDLMRKCRENHRQPSSFSFPNGFFRKKIKWKHFVLLFSRKSSLLGFRGRWIAAVRLAEENVCRRKCFGKENRFALDFHLFRSFFHRVPISLPPQRESREKVLGGSLSLAKIIYVPFRQLHYGNNWINTVRKSLKQWFSCAFPPTKNLTLKWDSN